MRTTCFVLMFAVIGALGLFGQEAVAYPNQGVSLGGGAIMQTQKSGGGSEIGIKLFGGDAWAFRSAITVSGFGTHADDPTGVFHLGAKFSIGGFLNEHFNSYGFIGGGLGLFGAEAPESGNEGAPIALDVLGGGGIEIFGSEYFSFFAEFGGGWGFLSGSGTDQYAGRGLDSGFTHITLGTRFYL